MSTFGSGFGSVFGQSLGGAASYAQAFAQAQALRREQARRRAQEELNRAHRRTSNVLGLELLQLLYPPKVAVLRSLVGLVPEVKDAEFTRL